MKIAYFGTGEFSKNILSTLIQSNEIEILLTVSQPDKPIGRKKELIYTPVKKLSMKNNIEVLQPESLKNNIDLEEKLKSLNLDFIIVVAYGKIIPVSILSIPKYYPINIHGSVLPYYRGASPVQESLKNGDTTTGITIMQISKGMDEGDIFDIKKINIDILDKTPDIFRKFEEIGGEFLLTTLKKIISGQIRQNPQNNIKATYCSKISKIDGEIDFRNENLLQIYNKFRAYYPWPGVYTYFNFKKIQFTDIFFEENDLDFDEYFRLGDVVEFEEDNKKEIGILCNGGILLLKGVKLEGKKEMDINTFMNGNKDFLDYNFLD